ncbi:Gfo/Idh/MocA family oxidoreductase [Aquibium sp. LZ166]|uniref:Gfo/Idh/MocA family oxidoreductase n=1 Tax=Aquibium pacificus TaxID=3153579 RepID=A0ABV3SML4_9HYPH
MTKPLRVGLIGASVDPSLSWGTRAHIPAIRHLPQFDLTAICTSRPDTAEAAARHFGVPLAFCDPDEMAAHPQVDVVAVSVRTPLHGRMVRSALDAGKHVYCEWPLGSTTAEARETLAQARRAGVVTMIGLQGRSNETIAHARDLVAEGFVGRMISASLKVTQENFGHLETAGNAYTADIRNGADILRIATGQALEAFCFAVGEFDELTVVVSRQYDTASIVGSGRVIDKSSPDLVMIAGRLANSADAFVHIRGGVSPAAAGVRLEINGTDGDLVLTSPGSANVHRTPLRLAGARRGDVEFHEIPLPERYALQPAGLADGPPRYLAHNYLRLASAIRNDEPVVVDFDYAVRHQELLDLVQTASDTGMRQTWR